MVRLKHRYLIGQVIDDSSIFSVDAAHQSVITSRDIQSTFADTICKLYGDVGSGAFGSSTAVKYFDQNLNVYVIRTSRDHLTQVQFALTCMTSAKKTSNLIFQTLAVAGSARTCKDKLLEILRACVGVHCAGDESRREELILAHKEQVERLEI